MSLRFPTVGLAVMAGVAMPAAAWGMGVGVPGCINLPEYVRAVGALQGMTSACDMSVEQARRIVAEHDHPAAAPQQVAPRLGPHRRPRRGRPARH